MGFGAKIKEILKQQKKTIKQLSEESGISKNTLYSITKRDSTYVTYPVLEQIAAALHVSVEELTPDDTRAEVEENTNFAMKAIEDSVREAQKSGAITPFDNVTRDSIHQGLLEMEINQLSYSQISKATDLADELYLKNTEGVPDTFIKKELLELFSGLNRRGQFEALERLRDLWDNPRFKK